MTHTAIDLFCGAGGASLGIENAGFDVVAAVDHNEAALATHERNLDHRTIQHDLADVDPSVLPTTNVDYLHGSPPCKGFSEANKDRGKDDPRNALVFDFIRWVNALQPKVVSMENVTGMLNITTGFMGQVKAAYRDAGYQVKHKTLNAADYGVPQSRKRVFTIAIRDDVTTPSRWFPQPTHAEAATQRFDGSTVSEWVGVCAVSGQIDAHKSQGRTSPAAWRAPTDPAHAITGQGNHVIEADGDVKALPVEVAKQLQSFPAWYDFGEKVTDAYLQIGNAVPPQLQQHVAEHLRGLLP